MKNLKLLSVLVMLVSFLACDNTESNQKTQHGDDLIGIWKLVKVYGGIAGTMFTYPEGTITWTFDPNTKILNVVNNNTAESADGDLETGNYSYEFVDGETGGMCEVILKINQSEYGCYYINEGRLLISQNYADGLTYEFIK
jgi:hypothetical protein